MSATLLVELLTEELPPKSLRRLSESFGQSLKDQLALLGFLTADAQTQIYATPRRLAVQIQGVAMRSPDQVRREKILPVSVALDAQGQATPPLLRKLAALGLSLQDVEGFERAQDGKQESFFFQRPLPGQGIQEGLQVALTRALADLPIPKVMNYQLADGTTTQFVRPAHRLVALMDDWVVPVTALGLSAGRTTEGHRFMGRRVLDIRHASQYARQLAEEARVVASYEERRQQIESGLRAAAGAARVVMPEALLEEVTSLVEWPVVYEGHFDADFLKVPQECLILTMQQNQKYFALTDEDGNMQPRFLLVSNLQSTAPDVVTGGNERVLRARLSDARFFYQQDLKKTLVSRVPALEAVVYHHKLGHQLDRTRRVMALAQELAQRLGANPAWVARAAELAKADLLTDMVGEFPELQGIMGSWYARHDGEAPEVAAAMTEHYQPRFAGDALPTTTTGMVVALADKLETLAGIWGIGLLPTGDRDPFALRRHALGVMRMLVEKSLPLNLRELLVKAFGLFSSQPHVKPAVDELEQFMMDRLRGYLRDRGYATNQIEAVLAVPNDHHQHLLRRMEAVRVFAGMPEAQSLSAANKRIGNLLKKSGELPVAPDPARFTEPQEHGLDKALGVVGPRAQELYEQGDFTGSLQELAKLRVPVDGFFEGVMVMAEDPSVRANRIGLLAQLHRAMNQVADLSRLA